jgi:hypothetical protein
MKITSDRIEITSGARDMAGERLEPEQQPTVRRMLSEALAQGTMTGEKAGKMAVEIQHHTTAGELAAQLRHACVNCANYDEQAFRSWVQSCLEGGPAKRTELKGVMQVLAAQGRLSDDQLMMNLDGPDAARILSVIAPGIGLCRVLSELAKEPVIVSGMGMDPEGFDGFRPTTKGQANGGRAFDLIMQRADGKI